MGDLFSMASKFGIASILRIGLSGLILVLLILPVQNTLVADMLRVDELGDFVTIVVPEAFIMGMFLTFFQNVIYRVYEGRLLWPARIHDAMTVRMNSKVQRRLKKTKDLKSGSARYRELWFWLRMFPLDEKGDPVAARPTLLGNILEGYEIASGSSDRPMLVNRITGAEVRRRAVIDVSLNQSPVEEGTRWN